MADIVKIRKKEHAFVEGAITPSFIANSITKHQMKTSVGAHSIFLGQVRNDVVDDNEVVAIHYTAYSEMAEKLIQYIRQRAFANYNLECLHIFHSLGLVKKGEICLFVFSSSKHRNDSFRATRFVVEKIKSSIPIFGKEVFRDNTHQWKTNDK